MPTWSLHTLLAAGLISIGAWFPGCPFDGDDDSGNQVWMSIAPVQCQGNAWEMEGKTIEDYLADHGADVIDLKTSTWADAVCLACSCPSGQRIDVLIDENDVEAVLALGFVREDDWPN